MSIDAQNIKIITQGGMVTLRGPVSSVEEKKRIEDIARSVAGADKVDSQLDVQQQR
jgi:hyperosmotically inducible periplasmic protein